MQYDNCNISALYQYLSIYPLQYTSPSCRYSPLSDVRVVREELVEDDYVRRRRIMCSVSMHFSSGPTAAAIADYLQMITLENLQQQFRRPKHCFRWISSRFSKMLYCCCRQGCSCEGGGLLFVPLLLLRCHYFVLDTWMMVILGAQRGSTPLGYKSSGIRTRTIAGTRSWGDQKMQNIRVTENRCYLTFTLFIFDFVAESLANDRCRNSSVDKHSNVCKYRHKYTNEKYYFPKSIDCPQKIVFSTNTNQKN